jgi:hypothetical protein
LYGLASWLVQNLLFKKRILLLKAHAGNSSQVVNRKFTGTILITDKILDANRVKTKRLFRIKSLKFCLKSACEIPLKNKYAVYKSDKFPKKSNTQIPDLS